VAIKARDKEPIIRILVALVVITHCGSKRF